MAGDPERRRKGRDAWEDWPEVPGYQVEHLLGHGGNSAVYRALQEATGSTVALKVLTLQRHDLGAALARLEREARIGRRLVHPDIVPVLDFGQDGRRAWIAMELLDGFELTHALTDPSFRLKDRLDVVLRVAGALHYAHGQGVVHRDVKPSNIFMTREGGVRLLDFGIAHVKVDLRLTRSGVIVGTPRYMAPEQVTGGEIDPRTDVFSLGVVLYQALTGALPWEADSIPKLIIAVATRPPHPAARELAGRGLRARRRGADPAGGGGAPGPGGRAGGALRLHGGARPRPGRVLRCPGGAEPGGRGARAVEPAPGGLGPGPGGAAAGRGGARGATGGEGRGRRAR
jgi:serine/threonine protein kinase